MYVNVIIYGFYLCIHKSVKNVKNMVDINGQKKNKLWIYNSIPIFPTFIWINRRSNKKNSRNTKKIKHDLICVFIVEKTEMILVCLTNLQENMRDDNSTRYNNEFTYSIHTVNLK